jgi:SAM-dependent methyltransferase
MAHPEQQAFVAAVAAAFPEFFRHLRVLEVGSLDVNGSVRRHFQDCDYTGLDVGEGPGVDVVCQGQDYDAPDAFFDVVISCEVMEHNPHWPETFANMVRLCRPGGLLVMTCATFGRVEHGTRRTTPEHAPLIPWDYYRNLGRRDFERRFGLRGMFDLHAFLTDFASCDLYFVGFRAGTPAPAGAEDVLAALRARYRRKNASSVRNLRRQVVVRLLGDRRYIEGKLRRRGQSSARG